MTIFLKATSLFFIICSLLVIFKFCDEGSYIQASFIFICYLLVAPEIKSLWCDYRENG